MHVEAGEVSRYGVASCREGAMDRRPEREEAYVSSALRPTVGCPSPVHFVCVRHECCHGGSRSASDARVTLHGSAE